MLSKRPREPAIQSKKTAKHPKESTSTPKRSSGGWGITGIIFGAFNYHVYFKKTPTGSSSGVGMLAVFCICGFVLFSLIGNLDRWLKKL
jgi:hypothetical protein